MTSVSKMPSLICASTSVLKFNSNVHDFERLCFVVRHDWSLRKSHTTKTKYLDCDFIHIVSIFSGLNDFKIT